MGGWLAVLHHVPSLQQQDVSSSSTSSNKGHVSGAQGPGGSFLPPSLALKWRGPAAGRVSSSTTNRHKWHTGQGCAERWCSHVLCCRSGRTQVEVGAPEAFPAAAAVYCWRVWWEMGPYCRASSQSKAPISREVYKDRA